MSSQSQKERSVQWTKGKEMKRLNISKFGEWCKPTDSRSSVNQEDIHLEVAIIVKLLKTEDKTSILKAMRKMGHYSHEGNDMNATEARIKWTNICKVLQHFLSRK